MLFIYQRVRRLVSMSVQMNIERKPVIQRGYLTIDLQCCTVLLAGEEIILYPKEFDVLHLLVQYPGAFSGTAL